jgi:ComF family protein
MLKSLGNFISKFFDSVLPPRTDFAIVKKLDEKTVATLPEASPVEGADWIFPLFKYRENRVRALVWELKYKENILALEHIGKRLYEEIIEHISDIVLFDSDAEFLLIPIPISYERRSTRGYNQSEHIAKAILEYDTGHSLLYAPQWFSKVKDTPEQNKSTSKQERIQNLHGCFEADPRVAGKYVILVDDVVTTGSTLFEARVTILSAGARNVYAFTIAH